MFKNKMFDTKIIIEITPRNNIKIISWENSLSNKINRFDLTYSKIGNAIENQDKNKNFKRLSSFIESVKIIYFFFNFFNFSFMKADIFLKYTVKLKAAAAINCIKNDPVPGSK